MTITEAEARKLYAEKLKQLADKYVAEFPSSIKVANGTEQLRPLAEVSEEADVAYQVCDPAGHHDTVVARGGEMLAQPVVEAGDLRCATLGVVRLRRLLGHDGLLPMTPTIGAFRQATGRPGHRSLAHP